MTMMHHYNLQSSPSNISSPTFGFPPKVKVQLSICFGGEALQSILMSSVADVMTTMHDLNPHHPTPSFNQKG